MDLRAVDAVVVGLGWSGAIFAKELAEAGLQVVALERGPWRDTIPDFVAGRSHDEIAWGLRRGLMQDLSRQTVTFRHSPQDRALPQRWPGPFQGAEGVGGSGVTWGGQACRMLPADFRMHSGSVRRYGRRAVPSDSVVQDWPVSYDDLEPFYDRFEFVCGVSGRAGNIGGHIILGGNPHEGPRSRDYPNPPGEPTLAMTLFAGAASDLGHHPFPLPCANPSRPTINSYGLTLEACTRCGYCEGYGCEAQAKASPQVALLPSLLGLPNFELRTRTQVLEIELDSTGRRAVAVIYGDAGGRRWRQPAEMVVLAAGGLDNVHLLLVSGVGGGGLVGRNFSRQTAATVHLFFGDRAFHPAIGAGGLGMAIDDRNGDNFDHTGLDYIGGGIIAALSPGAPPIAHHPLPPNSPRWGSGWKRAVKYWYGRTMTMSVTAAGLADLDTALDLDPTYTDAWGRKLLRLTCRANDNDTKASAALLDEALRIGRALRPSHITHSTRPGHASGGAIMGDDPRTSVVNRYLQSWEVGNLFVTGRSAFPTGGACDPTLTVGALAYWSAAHVVARYLGTPGPLV
jgi:gluconate 2-dehydrogenase alpha chain